MVLRKLSSSQIPTEIVVSSKNQLVALTSFLPFEIMQYRNSSIPTVDFVEKYRSDSHWMRVWSFGIIALLEVIELIF